jgi:hypothetical protein
LRSSDVEPNDRGTERLDDVDDGARIGVEQLAILGLRWRRNGGF